MLTNGSNIKYVFLYRVTDASRLSSKSVLHSTAAPISPPSYIKPPTVHRVSASPTRTPGRTPANVFLYSKPGAALLYSTTQKHMNHGMHLCLHAQKCLQRRLDTFKGKMRMHLGHVPWFMCFWAVLYFYYQSPAGFSKEVCCIVGRNLRMIAWVQTKTWVSLWRQPSNFHHENNRRNHKIMWLEQKYTQVFM